MAAPRGLRSRPPGAPRAHAPALPPRVPLLPFPVARCLPLLRPRLVSSQRPQFIVGWLLLTACPESSAVPRGGFTPCSPVSGTDSRAPAPQAGREAAAPPSLHAARSQPVTAASEQTLLETLEPREPKATGVPSTPDERSYSESLQENLALLELFS